MRFCKTITIVSVLSVLTLPAFSKTHYLLKNVGDNQWETRNGLAAYNGHLLLQPQYLKIARLSDDFFWCSSTNEIWTIYGDNQQETHLVAPDGNLIVDEIFAEHIDDFPPMLPKLICDGIFYAHLLRDGTPIPVLLYKNGHVHEIAAFSHFDVDNPDLAYCKVDDGYRLFSIKEERMIGPVYEEIKTGRKNAFVKSCGEWRLVKFESDSLQDVLGIGFDSMKCHDDQSSLWKICKEDEQGVISEDGIWQIPLQKDFHICDPALPYVGWFKVSVEGKANIYDPATKKLVFDKGFGGIEEISRQVAECSTHTQEFFLVDIVKKKRISSIPVCGSFRRPLAFLDSQSPFWHATFDKKYASYWIKDGEVKVFPESNVCSGGFDVGKLVKLEKPGSSLEGVVNTQTGNVVVELERHSKVYPWADKIKSVGKDGHIFLLDLQGDVLAGTNGVISAVDNPDSSGYARIVCDGKAGLIDGDCDFALPCLYEDVGHFGEGLVPAKHGGKWGFVELSGKWAVNPGFDGAREFKNGHAPVCMGGKWGFIGKDGKPSTPFAYEDVKDVRDGHFRAKTGGKWGIFALDGTCKLPAEYDDILADDEYGYGEP